jgi:hypothetical protein
MRGFFYAARCNRPIVRLTADDDKPALCEAGRILAANIFTFLFLVNLLTPISALARQHMVAIPQKREVSSIMHLPTPIYERVPQFWLLLGLLFMASGTYLGFDYSLSFMYFGVGIACAVWSMWIFSMRATARGHAPAQKNVSPPATADAQTEQQQHEILNQGAETPA